MKPWVHFLWGATAGVFGVCVLYGPIVSFNIIMILVIASIFAPCAGTDDRDE